MRFFLPIFCWFLLVGCTKQEWVTAGLPNTVGGPENLSDTATLERLSTFKRVLDSPLQFEIAKQALRRKAYAGAKAAIESGFKGAGFSLRDEMARVWWPAALALAPAGKIAALHARYRQLILPDQKSDAEIGARVMAMDSVPESLKIGYAREWARQNTELDPLKLAALLKDAPFYPFFVEKMDAESGLLFEAMQAYGHHDEAKAAGKLDRYLAGNFKKDPKRVRAAARARFEIFRDYHDRPAYLKALKKYLTLSDAADFDDIADVRNRIAGEEWFFGRLSEAEVSLREVLADSRVDKKQRQLAYVLLAERVLAESKPSEVEPVFEAAIQEATEPAPKANLTIRLAFHRYLKNDFEGAFKRLSDSEELFSANKLIYPAKYWQGRALEKMGRAAEAKERFQFIVERAPLDYYGFASTICLGLPIVSHRKTLSATSDFKFLLPKSWPGKKPAVFDEAELLLGLGLKSLAANGVKDIFRDYPVAADEPDYQRYLGYLGNQAGLYLYGLWALGEIGDPDKRTWANPDLEANFPRPYFEDFRATKNPETLLGLAKQESALTADIISESLGYGILQFQERTGREVAKALGVKNFKTRDLLDPKTNIRFADFYLESLYQKMGRRLPLAIAAYNAGDFTVERWLKNHPYREDDPTEFIDAIPGDITRRHVKNVLKNRMNYFLIYGDTVPDFFK